MDAKKKKEKYNKMLLHLCEAFLTACQNCNIKGWLWAGTFLGAVRDGGIIPWDDDLDVCVLAEDISALENYHWPEDMCFTKTFDTMYTLHLKGTFWLNEHYHWYESLKQGGACGVHIDIFPIFHLPDDITQAAKFVDDSVHGRLNYNEKVKAYYGSNTMFDLLKLNNHEIALPSDSFYLDPVMVKFEGAICPVVHNPEAALKKIYGDFKTPVRWGGYHRIVVDVENGWEKYASGDLVIPPYVKPSLEECDVQFI